MTTPNPLAKTKGAGTTFWMYTGKGDAFANPLGINKCSFNFVRRLFISHSVSMDDMDNFKSC
ncbi:hypothetical protein IPCEC31_35070 [Escherichia coli]|nr:hypothetical protein IPCEC31_35070 [Escherichia coli]